MQFSAKSMSIDDVEKETKIKGKYEPIVCEMEHLIYHRQDK